MQYIHFIVNPVSGKGKHLISAAYLREHFCRDMFRVEVDYTTHKKHAIELTKKAVGASPDCIVACGGDGTINEVASQIINTNIKLGVIPVGSGNGLASNLGIPRDIGHAIELIRHGNTTFIDVGKINEYYFFSNMGTGIDATIIKQYESSGKRTLTAYIISALLASRKYNARKSIIDVNDRMIEVSPLLLFVSNSNEMGYGMALTPSASLRDGMLDLVIVKKLSFWHMMLLGYYVLRNKIPEFKHVQHLLIKDLYIEIPDNIFTNVQIDGEYHNLKTNMLTVSVIDKALNVVVPLGFKN